MSTHESADKLTELSAMPAPLVELDQFAERSASLNNFDGTPDNIWRLTAYATGPSCEAGRKILGQRFPLKYWFIHEVQLEIEGGELIRAPRVVLIDPQGAAFGFVSMGIYNSLRLLVQSLGFGPYDPPVTITVREGQGRQGRTFYAIEPAPLAADLKATKK